MILRTLFTLTISTCLLSACSDYGEPVHSLEVAAKGLHNGTISHNHDYAVVGSIHHGGSLWRLEDEERLFNWNHTGQGAADEKSTIVASAFSGDDQFAATADPFTLVLWETSSGVATRYWTAPGEILDIDLGERGRRALLGLSDHSAVLFDIQRGGILQTLPHGDRVQSVDLSRDGRYALTGSEDYHARFWDLRSGQILRDYQHDDAVQLVRLSDNGELALSVSKYDKALLWYTDTGEPLGELPLNAERLKRGLHFTTARFNREGTRLLTGRPDQMVQLWDVQKLRLLAQWELPQRDAWKPTSAAVLDVSFTGQADEFIAIASNGFVHRLKADNATAP